MIFPKEFELKIGFAPLRQIIVDKCETRLGKQAAMEMDFCTVYDEIRRRLMCVSEMLALISSAVEMPEENVHDVVMVV